MKVLVTHVGTMNSAHHISWPEDWPIPPVGAEVNLPALPEVTSVRTVIWYPQGASTAYNYPHVYIVLGPRRP